MTHNTKVDEFLSTIFYSFNSIYIHEIDYSKVITYYEDKCFSYNDFIVQQYSDYFIEGYFQHKNYLKDYNVEIGILYENGKILEIVEKTNKDDEIRFFKNDNKKSYYNLIDNEKINNIINNISKLIPNMNVARYDIRLKNINDLEKGNFKIIEINGTMGMSFEYYFDIIWYFRRLFIGIKNILTLNGYSPVQLPIVMFKSYYSMIKCNDNENLFSLYS
jgi:hypothetical protein